MYSCLLPTKEDTLLRNMILYEWLLQNTLLRDGRMKIKRGHAEAFRIRYMGACGDMWKHTETYEEKSEHTLTLM